MKDNKKDHPILDFIEALVDLSIKVIWVFCELLAALVKPFMK